MVFISFAAALSAQRFDSVLNKLDTEYPQEKLYLHFDKSAYNPGETIWFKAYLFSANYPSDISKTLYAELVDAQGKVLDKKSAPVFMAGAAAAFDLPTDLTSPVVYVRAYTRWMLNFDSSFLFVKAFPILTGKKLAGKSVTSNPTAYLHFFPEGGDLVEGVESRVAFKGNDQKGFPIQFGGEVINSKGKKMAVLNLVHDGMGYFNLLPEPGEEYKVKWKDAYGQQHESLLPIPRKSGVVLEVHTTQQGIQFTVKRSAQPLVNGAIYVVAQMQQQLLYRAKANLAVKTSIEGIIPVENFPSGIVQLTVFTEDGSPLAERIVFMNRQDYYFITDLNAAVKDLGARGKNVIRIDVPDTIVSNLSIAVTDAEVNPATKEEEDIFSNVLLTSDIKGYVHHPAYYFSSDADSVAAHLDLVMMTNGWRRFRWEEVLANHWPALRFKPDNYLAIEGRIGGLTKSVLQQKELTGILQTKNGGKQFLTIPVDPDGKFEIPGLVYFDTARIYYQFNNDKNRTLTTRANFDFSNNLMKEWLRLQIPANQESYVVRLDTGTVLKNKDLAQKSIVQQKKVQTLATVEVRAKQRSRQEKMEEEYTSGFFTGDGNTFILEDDPFALSSGNIFSYLQGKVAGLQITMNGGQVGLSWRGGSPALFLDEMELQDASMLQTMPITDVALVKVFRPPFFGGSRGSNGAIAVYTKKGSSANQAVKGLDFATIPGYTPVRQFYSPDYEKDAAKDKDDYRTTLYWNPFVLTDKNNRRVMLTFFNNDITKKIRVVIEGCNADGKLTRMEKVFE